MSVFIGYAASFFRRSLGVPARLKSPLTPLYYRRPRGVAAFAPALIAIDALITVNTIDVTWRRWKEPPKGSDNGEAPPLRPRWLRLTVCSMELFTGLLIAASLLIHRSRTTTLLAILQPKSVNAAPTPHNRRIFIQTSGNWRTNGTIYPLSACTLTRVEKKILFLQIKGEYSGWQIDIDRSLVDGRPVDSDSGEKACKTIAILWTKAGGKGTILTSY